MPESSPPVAHSSAAPAGNVLGAGARECMAGLAQWRIAHLDGVAVLRRRYARSRLGQFWLTLSTGASIAALGAVWTLLWKQPAAEIFPYIAVSLVLWNFINAVITEGANVFVNHAHALQHQGMAVSTWVYALLYRCVLVLAHDAVIVVAVIAVFGIGLHAQTLLFIPAFALALVAGFCAAYLLGMLCTRYRDMILFTATAMQLLFYITPVLWKRDFLPEGFDWITQVNPLATFLSILREPLLGRAPALEAWGLSALCTALLLLVTLYAAGRVRRRLVYWI